MHILSPLKKDTTSTSLFEPSFYPMPAFMKNIYKTADLDSVLPHFLLFAEKSQFLVIFQIFQFLERPSSRPSSGKLRRRALSRKDDFSERKDDLLGRRGEDQRMTRSL